MELLCCGQDLAVINQLAIDTSSLHSRSLLLHLYGQLQSSFQFSLYRTTETCLVVPSTTSSFPVVLPVLTCEWVYTMDTKRSSRGRNDKSQITNLCH